MMGGDGAGVHVMGEQLREVDAPIEALVGASNGLIHGAGLAAMGSAALTFVESGGIDGKQILTKMTSTHLGGIIGTALGFAALSGFIRYSRAAKHNEWSKKHYEFLQSKIDSAKDHNHEEPKSFAQREDKKRESSARAEIG